MDRTRLPNFTIDVTIRSQHEAVALANQLAWKHAADPEIRGLATAITRSCPARDNLFETRRDHAFAIQSWIVDNVDYRQEVPFGELLQGPHTTLPYLELPSHVFRGHGVGDCDDLSILYASLMTSLGHATYVAGIGYVSSYPRLFHAKAYLPDNLTDQNADGGTFIELSLDDSYDGDPAKLWAHTGVERGTFAVTYCPRLKAYFRHVV
jgi:hypothetical protein